MCWRKRRRRWRDSGQRRGFRTCMGQPLLQQSHCMYWPADSTPACQTDCVGGDIVFLGLGQEGAHRGLHMHVLCLQTPASSQRTQPASEQLAHRDSRVLKCCKCFCKARGSATIIAKGPTRLLGSVGAQPAHVSPESRIEDFQPPVLISRAHTAVRESATCPIYT